MPCRVNRQRLWSTRIYLEGLAHAASCFCTLTYRRFDVPWNLESRELQLFLKRLRTNSGVKFRFYAAGEYGDRTGRPHFHVMLFGFPMTAISVIAACWPYGFVHVGEFNLKTARYISKYVTKRWIGDERDPRFLDRVPEFSRMSRRPHGIGAEAMEATIEALVEAGGARGLAGAGDVPGQVRVEGRRHPMGRYLRKRLREGVGWDGGAPPEVRRAVSLVDQNKSFAEKAARRKISADRAAKLVELSDSKRRLK